MQQSAVRAELWRQGRKLKWLAAEVQIERSQLAKKLAGKVSVTPEEAERIARALDIPRYAIFEGYDLRIRTPRPGREPVAAS